MFNQNLKILSMIHKKIIDITVEERPTGEIFAGAGAGTAGATITAGIKENNYLEKELNLQPILHFLKIKLKVNFLLLIQILKLRSLFQYNN